MSFDILLLALYSATIYWLSDQPSLPAPMLFPHQDKLIHLAAYAVMGLLAWRCVSRLPLNQKTMMVIALIYCLIFAFTDEWHQSYIPGRTADIFDWIADAVGASIVIGWFGVNRESVNHLK